MTQRGFFARFRNLSIKAKLITVILSVCTVTLIATCMTFFAFQRQSLIDGTIQKVRLLAEVLGENCSSAIAFEDAVGASEILGALQRDEGIVRAAVVLNDGRQFAYYARENFKSDRAVPDLKGKELLVSDDYLTVSKPIIADGRTLANVWIESDLTEVQRRSDLFLRTSLIILLAASFLGLLAAILFQKVLTRPIGQLRQAAEKLAIGDLDFEISYSSKDELGILAETFRNIRAYMTSLTEAANLIAARDLTGKFKRISDKDVLGKSFEDMIATLWDLLATLNSSAESLVSGATTINESSRELSGGAKEQAGQIEQVSEAVTAITSAIIQASTSVNEASQTTRKASDVATNAGEVVLETIAGINQVSESVEKAAEAIKALSGSVEQIAEITGMIDDVADQTNLLALNAAIEAARAGEAGRGFAVVADEVRKLADGTVRATAKISSRVKAIQSATNEAIQAMATGQKEVSRGRELAESLGGNLSEIVSMSQSVMDMTAEMADAAEHQTKSATDISERIDVIKSLTRGTADQAENAEGAARELDQKAQELKETIAGFTV